MNKNEISNTKQIIMEIFIIWFNNISFDSEFWLEENKLNETINILLEEKNKIVNLFAIKFIRNILENTEPCIIVKILSKNICENIINIFKTNLKSQNMIYSTLKDFF